VHRSSRFVLQFVSNIDKGNIGFAATQGLTMDIRLKGSDLNVFYGIPGSSKDLVLMTVVTRLQFPFSTSCIFSSRYDPISFIGNVFRSFDSRRRLLC
jgi:hypothetical protein